MAAMISSLYLLSICTSSSLMTSDSVNVTLEVPQVEEIAGSIFIAVYTTEDSYMDTDKAFTSARVPVTSKEFSWTCELPHGKYAFVIFHDVDNNGELNTSRLGLPKEPYGFSNNAKGLFGPPGFDQAAVMLEQDSTISISLK